MSSAIDFGLHDTYTTRSISLLFRRTFNTLGSCRDRHIHKRNQGPTSNSAARPTTETVDTYAVRSWEGLWVMVGDESKKTKCTKMRKTGHPRCANRQVTLHYRNDLILFTGVL